jgi:hypothetical protein
MSPVYPRAHADGQLRTLQRRLKQWRREMAHDLVLGSSPAASDTENGAIVLAAGTMVGMKEWSFGRTKECNDEAMGASLMRQRDAT